MVSAATGPGWFPDPLEDAACSTAAPHPTDRLATCVTVTDEGRELATAATEALSEKGFGMESSHNADGGDPAGLAHGHAGHGRRLADQVSLSSAPASQASTSPRSVHASAEWSSSARNTVCAIIR